jgi:tetratricopeptide (TPR) repeat protein
MREQLTPSSSSIPRRWRVPGHYLHSTERFDGAGILDENPGPPGLLLWQRERDVRLWALSSASEREFLFAEGASSRGIASLRELASGSGELVPALQALAGMLAHPLEAGPDMVMLACRRVSIWAEQCGRYATALRFAESAALAQPRVAECAYHVGRLARRGGHTGLAEGWLNRAIVLARQLADWDTYAAAYSGLGNVSLTRGNLPAAERYQHKALRIATKHGLPARAGAALHDIFVVAAEAEQLEKALDFAERAFCTYPGDHPARVALAHDTASYCLLQGQFRYAIPILEAVYPLVEEDQRSTVLANLARATGAVGDRPRFEEYHRRGRDDLQNKRTDDRRSGDLLSLARGCASMGNWEEAQELAEYALALASERLEHKVVFEAEAFHQSLMHERVALAPQRLCEELSSVARLSTRIATALAGRATASAS